MITALLAGLAALWLWAVLNDEDGAFAVVPRVLSRSSVTQKWLSCPWCSGAWFAIAGSLWLEHSAVGVAVITALAAAAVTGLLGSYIGGE